MNPRRKFQLIGAGSVGAVVAALLTASPAAAQPITVVPCSATALSAAITAANVAGSGELLLIPGCTYTLTSAAIGEDGLPPITGAIDILGAGDTITRSSAAAFRIFDVTATGRLTLAAGLTVSGGNPTTDGGGIANAGQLDLDGVTVRDNTTAGQGGGIANTGTVDLNASRVMSNTAVTGGGGVSNSATATLNSQASSIDNNSTTGNASLGGGVLNNGGTVSGSLASIGSNSATGAGSSGGGLATVGGRVALRGGTVENNRASTAPGGINNSAGTVSLLLTGVFGNSPTNCAGSPSPVSGCND